MIRLAARFSVNQKDAIRTTGKRLQSNEEIQSLLR